MFGASSELASVMEFGFNGSVLVHPAHYAFSTTMRHYKFTDLLTITNEVAQRRARLVLRWVTVRGNAVLVRNQPLRSTQPLTFSGTENECDRNVTGHASQTVVNPPTGSIA